MALLEIRAGTLAYAKIKESGLSAADIGAVFGASGAAKWLAISGLDAAIFGDWLSTANQTIALYGTSVGAWKLAAAAQDNPRQALHQFAQAYCHQRYGKTISHDDIQSESNKIISTILSQEKIQQVLNNRRYHFHCGAILSKGWLASESKPRLVAAMLKAGLANSVSRQHLRHQMQRVIFSDPRTKLSIDASDMFATQTVLLNHNNFVAALLASGSIPYWMAGVKDIETGPKGIYRDGGLLDYHPIPDQVVGTGFKDKSFDEHKLILYPHFYPYLTPGWFDKFSPWRKASPDRLKNVVLIYPSQKFIASLPNNRIPSRQDFKRYRGRNDERIAIWQQCIEKSQALGTEFLEKADSSQFKRDIQPL